MAQIFKFNALLSFLIIFISANGVLSYGWVGHQITAAIAQRFLSPRAQRAIIELLPQEANGNLSEIAAWADTIRFNPHYRFASRLHFWNPIGDNPPETCSIDWVPGNRDVITAIYNYSHRLDPKTRLEYTQQAEALKFLVHFLGDLHQPLHLTSKLRGGNGAVARFDNRKTKLHTIWDSLLICKQICKVIFDSKLPITKPKPPKCPRCEINLEYVNNIVSLINTKWNEEKSRWTECHNRVKDNSYVRIDFFKYDRIVSFSPRRRPTNPKTPFPIPDVPDSICPNYWAIELKKLNCEVIWKGYSPNTEIDYGHGEFYDSLMKSQLVEKMLAMAGIRMAAVLNSILT
ncbi:3054_t:CDS:2 [Ambispora leptoticha]|uniref:3054_t:CDS:1 n=1 Tax=Ambispora leptoticha TaxID=144679 RepID=A0A9N9CDT6_9GLOM|nr:3054_t:CDS:2 [Ambispora leptoticha]